MKQLLCALLVLSMNSVLVAGEKEKPAADGVVFELRTYTTHDGKLPDLLTRFRDHTVKLFEKHGMTNVGYWVPVDQPNTLVYLLKHKNAAAAKDSWNGFRNDPQWKKAFAASRENGPIVSKVVSQYLNSTDFSALK